MKPCQYPVRKTRKPGEWLLRGLKSKTFFRGSMFPDFPHSRAALSLLLISKNGHHFPWIRACERDSKFHVAASCDMLVWTSFLCSGADAGTVFSWELRDPILLTEHGLLGPLNTLSAAGPVGEGYSTENEDATRLGKYTTVS